MTPIAYQVTFWCDKCYRVDTQMLCLQFCQSEKRVICSTGDEIKLSTGKHEQLITFCLYRVANITNHIRHTNSEGMSGKLVNEHFFLDNFRTTHGIVQSAGEDCLIGAFLHVPPGRQTRTKHPCSTFHSQYFLKTLVHLTNYPK